MDWKAWCATVQGFEKSQTRPSNWTELMGPDAMTLVFWMLRFKPAFLLKRLTHPLQRQAIPLEMLSKTEDPFTLLPLSILPFDFHSSLLFSVCSIKESAIQTPLRWLFWGTSLLCSRCAGFLKYFPCLNPSSLRFIGLLCSKQSKLGLSNKYFGGSFGCNFQRDFFFYIHFLVFIVKEISCLILDLRKRKKVFKLSFCCYFFLPISLHSAFFLVYI